jgi:hypothetical protein
MRIPIFCSKDGIPAADEQAEWSLDDEEVFLNLR